MATVYLIPTVLAEGATDAIPSYVLSAIRACTVLYVESERTSRRYLRALDRSIRIEDFEWVNMREATPELMTHFRIAMTGSKTVGILSEAGCPGIADPGAALVAEAHKAGATVKPLVGPSSILLALMGSGFNGQRFAFHGYLPIDAAARTAAIKELQSQSKKEDCTQLFIETPYRNDALLDALLKNCHPGTRLCIAANLTAPDESIRTQTIVAWRRSNLRLGKQPVMFLLHAGSGD